MKRTMPLYAHMPPGQGMARIYQVFVDYFPELYTVYRTTTDKDVPQIRFRFEDQTEVRFNQHEFIALDKYEAIATMYARRRNP